LFVVLRAGQLIAYRLLYLLQFLFQHFHYNLGASWPSAIKLTGLLFFVNAVKIKEKQAQQPSWNTNTTAIAMVKLFWMLSTPWILQNELIGLGKCST
jgi:hypothetical protein